MKTMAWQFAPVALLGAGVLLISGIREQYVMPPVKPMAAISRTFLGHEGKDVAVSDEEKRIAGMSDYMLRQFGPDSAPLFTVYVGYYDRQVQGKSIHSPKNCLPGAGWEVMDTKAVAVPGGSGTANRVLLSNKGASAMVYYWYQGRGRLEASEYRVKWDLMRDAALYGRTDEALVRIVLPLGAAPGTAEFNRETVRADSVAQKVMRELRVAVDGVMPPFAGG